MNLIVTLVTSFLSGPVNQYLSGSHADTVVNILIRSLLAVGVEPRLALQGYDTIAQWDKCLLRLPDYLKKMQICK